MAIVKGERGAERAERVDKHQRGRKKPDDRPGEHGAARAGSATRNSAAKQ